MKYPFVSAIIFISLSIPVVLFSQNNDTTTAYVANSDPAPSMLARYDRPTAFTFSSQQNKFSLGGYSSVNTLYRSTDGEIENTSFELGNFNLFSISSFRNDRIQVLTNLGYNTETNQLDITEASLNIAFAKAFNLRGGVILAPLGYYNQNGDSPMNNFIDDPISSSTIIPSRLSELGFGLSGLFDLNKIAITYEAYAVNGLQQGIVENELPRSAINIGKPENPFSADNNNSLSYTGRVAAQLSSTAEVGVSYYGGQYNTTEIDETEIDVARRIEILALDAKLNLAKFEIIGEFVTANIDVFDGLGQLFGEKQLGYHLEGSYPVFSNISLLGQSNNQLRLAFRYEYSDYNVGEFEQTGTNVFDQIKGFRAGAILRIAAKTNLRLNYSILEKHDILGNPSKIGSIQAGFASYF